MTLHTPEQNPSMAAQESNHRLADVLIILQNRPTALQHLTIPSVNSKFDLFEDCFHTMIKIPQETSEQNLTVFIHFSAEEIYQLFETSTRLINELSRTYQSFSGANT